MARSTEVLGKRLVSSREAARVALAAVRSSARSSALRIVVAGVLVACGGQGVRSQDPAASVAGSGGTATASAGSGGGLSGAGGAAQGAGGSGGALLATAGAAGHAGANGGGGGFANGGAAGSAGAGGTAGGVGGAAGGVGISTPEMLVPTVKAFCATARTCCAKQTDPVMLDDCESAFGTKDQTSQALARGTVAIDPADLAKCLAAYQAAATSCEENSVLAACAGIVHGI